MYPSETLTRAAFHISAVMNPPHLSGLADLPKRQYRLLCGGVFARPVAVSVSGVVRELVALLCFQN
jgi:hypothetical protein